MVGDKAPAMSARFENYFTSKSLSIQIAAFIWKNLELEGWWIHWVIYFFFFSDSPSRVNNYVFWWGARRGLSGKFSKISLLIAPGASDYPQWIYPQCRKPGFNPWVGKIPWRREWHSNPVHAWDFHGQRSLAGYSPQGHKELNTTEWLTNTHTYTHCQHLAV